jgi:hypothetical protein
MSLDKSLTKALGGLINVLEIELPKQERLDDYIDYIIEKIGPSSEDLNEQKHYVGKRWLEIRDQYDFIEDVLHIFNDGNEYLISIDGNIVTGRWRLLAETNSMIVENGDKKELYDLVFLNDNFLILAKHGDQIRLKQSRYLVLVQESLGSKLSWHQLMDNLYDVHRANKNYQYSLLVIIFLVAVIIAMSVF